jgi:phosphoribosyl 1,2-cyclic phosphodiesterase
VGLRLLPLGSGSAGNATLVELARTRLLVDAGLGARTLARRLAAAGVEPDSIDAILLTHEHQDHARGAERFSTRHGVPVVCSAITLEAMDSSPAHFARWQPLPPDGRLVLGGVRVEAFPVPHDAAGPVGFVVAGDGLRVGFAVDLGHATKLVVERLRGCDVLMVEANHDPELLRQGPYPWHLKQRVAGRMGHLSNAEAAALVAEVVDERCRAVVLAHLSERNNTPDLARQTVALALQRAGCPRASMRIAARRRTTPAVLLGEGRLF